MLNVEERAAEGHSNHSDPCMLGQRHQLLYWMHPANHIAVRDTQTFQLANILIYNKKIVTLQKVRQRAQRI